MIAGKDADGEGKIRLTGTASWNFVAISQYILGIKPEYDGLQVDPSIPKIGMVYVIENSEVIVIKSQ